MEISHIIGNAMRSLAQLNATAIPTNAGGSVNPMQNLVVANYHVMSQVAQNNQLVAQSNELLDAQNRLLEKILKLLESQSLLNLLGKGGGFFPPPIGRPGRRLPKTKKGKSRWGRTKQRPRTSSKPRTSPRAKRQDLPKPKKRIRPGAIFKKGIGAGAVAGRFMLRVGARVIPVVGAVLILNEIYTAFRMKQEKEGGRVNLQLITKLGQLRNMFMRAKKQYDDELQYLPPDDPRRLGVEQEMQRLITEIHRIGQRIDEELKRKGQPPLIGPIFEKDVEGKAAPVETKPPETNSPAAQGSGLVEPKFEKIFLKADKFKIKSDIFKIETPLSLEGRSGSGGVVQPSNSVAKTREEIDGSADTIYKTPEQAAQEAANKREEIDGSADTLYRSPERQREEIDGSAETIHKQQQSPQKPSPPQVSTGTPNDQGFINPLAKGSVISVHGDSRGGGSRLHRGIDLKGKTGEPIRATTANQKVTKAGWLGTNYGWGVKTIDSQGREHVYAHMDQDPTQAHGITPGKMLNQGDVIGGVGQSGNARFTPPHVHYEVRPGVGQYENSYDPSNFLFPGMNNRGRGFKWDESTNPNPVPLTKPEIQKEYNDTVKNNPFGVKPDMVPNPTKPPPEPKPPKEEPRSKEPTVNPYETRASTDTDRSQKQARPEPEETYNFTDSSQMLGWHGDDAFA